MTVADTVVEVRWAECSATDGAAGAGAALAGLLERFGRRALQHLDYRLEVSVLLCDARLMQELNTRYRGVAAPTDVLSFAQMEAPAPPPDEQPRGARSAAAGPQAKLGRRTSSSSVSRSDRADSRNAAGRWPGGADQGTVPAAGDVVIATDVAARQAAARGEPAERELCRLLLHGMLHLVGMDHADPPRECEPMLLLQERTLHRLLADAAPTTR